MDNPNYKNAALAAESSHEAVLVIKGVFDFDLVWH